MKVTNSMNGQLATVIFNHSLIQNTAVHTNSEGYSLFLPTVIGRDDIDCYDEKLDVYYNMTDDGSYLFDITKVLDPNDDLDIPDSNKLRDGFKGAAGNKLFELIRGDVIASDDFSYFKYMIESPAAMYSHYHANGKDEVAAQIALLNDYAKGRNDQMAAMLGTIAHTFGGMGITSISFDDGFTIDLNDIDGELDEMESMRDDMAESLAKLNLTTKS